MTYATVRGERQAELIIEAAYRILARHGYAATSLQRIADEAGVHKRMVSYYFGTRENLFHHIVSRVGQQLIDQFSLAVVGREDPGEIVAIGFDQLWSAIIRDPRPHAVYFGLVSEAVTDEKLRDSINSIGDRYRDLIGHLARTASARGIELRMRESTLKVAIPAAMQGLTLQYLMRGDTHELRTAVEDFKAWLTSLPEPATAGV